VMMITRQSGIGGTGLSLFSCWISSGHRQDCVPPPPFSSVHDHGHTMFIPPGTASFIWLLNLLRGSMIGRADL
jgi:hypothetical protein